MSVLQEERKQEILENKSDNLHNDLSPFAAPVRSWDKFWTFVFYGFFIFSASFGFGGLVLLKNQLNQDYQDKVEPFKWLVLVKGDPLEIDEVGRFLKQYPEAIEVTFLSPSTVFEQLQHDPLFQDDMNGIKPTDVPPCWQVKWEAQHLNFSQLEDRISETRRFPGVLDVAYDPQLIQSIQSSHRFWIEARFLLAFLAFLGVVASVLLAGRVLFFTELRKVDLKVLGKILLFNQFTWSLGYLFLIKTAGALPWYFLGGGIMAGLIHFLWITSKRRWT